MDAVSGLLTRRKDKPGSVLTKIATAVTLSGVRHLLINNNRSGKSGVGLRSWLDECPVLQASRPMRGVSAAHL